MLNLKQLELENKELHCKHRAPQDQETERTERIIRETQCKQD